VLQAIIEASGGRVRGIRFITASHPEQAAWGPPVASHATGNHASPGNQDRYLMSVDASSHTTARFPRWSTGNAAARGRSCPALRLRSRPSPKPSISTADPNPISRSSPTITRSSRLDDFCCPPCRDQIAIARGAFATSTSPQVPSLDGFGRRPQFLPALSKWAVIRNPSQTRKTGSSRHMAGPPTTAEIFAGDRHCRRPKTCTQADGRSNGPQKAGLIPT
jgi:hypothetical protein